jgi:DNA-binding transcriptional ArsR family regulator
LPDEDALAQETRRRVFAFVREHPGTHMREIQRRLAMSAGTLEYHLHVLVRGGLLTSRRQGRYLRYYVTADVGRQEKDVLGLLRQEVPRRLCAHLVEKPEQSHGELLQKFTIAPSTLSFHLKKLVDGGLVEAQRVGRETRFRVKDPAVVGRVLVEYKASFLDEVVDRFAEGWLSVSAGLEAAQSLPEPGLPPELPPELPPPERPKPADEAPNEEEPAKEKEPATEEGPAKEGEKKGKGPGGASSEGP